MSKLIDMLKNIKWLGHVKAKDGGSLEHKPVKPGVPKEPIPVPAPVKPKEEKK